MLKKPIHMQILFNVLMGLRRQEINGCSSYGKPRSKDFHWRHYKNLLRNAGLPDIRWHDLRSIYCTLLLKSDFSPKAVSKLMGHAKELITVNAYGDNSNIIPELISCMEDVMPERGQKGNRNSDVLDIMIDVETYLPQAGSDENRKRI